ncbi:hypothetical protein BG003_003399 [Podila horticola]|nr:hypothetical protein BG003_003399 [Podila horticola]
MPYRTPTPTAQSRHEGHFYFCGPPCRHGCHRPAAHDDYSRFYSDSDTPPWSNCATGPTQMNVTSFSASPNPLCAGQPLQFTATGSLAKSIVQGASFSIVGKFLSRVFCTDNYDLCQILAATGTPCPTAANITSLMINIRTKPNIPIGIPLVFSIQVRNGDGDIILC